MNTPFFITGLPRTRGAWLSNFFTTGFESLCYHDPKETASELVARHPGLRVGVADATLVFSAPALLDKWPEAPWLFVERDASEARRSLIKFTRETVRVLGRDIDQVFTAHAAAAGPVKNHPHTMTVMYEDLDARLPAIWKHLLPGMPFPDERHKLLKALKVEQYFSKLYHERMGR